MALSAIPAAVNLTSIEFSVTAVALVDSYSVRWQHVTCQDHFGGYVTADAAALCLKSGNATILRGGKEALNSNQAIARIMVEAGRKAVPFSDGGRPRKFFPSRGYPVILRRPWFRLIHDPLV